MKLAILAVGHVAGLGEMGAVAGEGRGQHVHPINGRAALKAGKTNRHLLKTDHIEVAQRTNGGHRSLQRGLTVSAPSPLDVPAQ